MFIHLIGKDARTVMKLFKKWLKDYNHVAPHSGLGMKSPLEYRKFMDKVVWLKWGSGQRIWKP